MHNLNLKSLSRVTFAFLTLLRDVIICLMTMRSARTRTLVTEERSKRAAFTIPVLSLNTVTGPSDRDGKAGPTSVSWAMVSPAGRERRVLVGSTTGPERKTVPLRSNFLPLARICTCLCTTSALLLQDYKSIKGFLQACTSQRTNAKTQFLTRKRAVMQRSSQAGAYFE